jgi:parvulin-like peptidyl-prolyl isomerase
MAAASFAQVDGGRTVVSVNGEDIKGEEYYRRMEYLPDVGRVLENGSVAVYPPGFLTMTQLIDEHLILQLAKQKGLTPTDQEINDTIKSSLAADPKMMERWMTAGRTEDELKYQFKYQVAQFKLQTQGIIISDQEVQDWYTKNPPKIPRLVTLRLIAVTDDAKMKAVDADLAAGKSFADVAKDKSEDVTQVNSGAVGTIPIDDLPKPVRDAVDSTTTGAVTGWIEYNNNHEKYLIESKAQEQKLPLDDTMKERLRRKLMLDKGAVKNNVMKEISDLRKSAKIDIKQKEWAAMYDNFVRTYLKG